MIDIKKNSATKIIAPKMTEKGIFSFRPIDIKQRNNTAETCDDVNNSTSSTGGMIASKQHVVEHVKKDSETEFVRIERTACFSLKKKV